MKGEPQWMRDFRLKSYNRFLRREMPNWGGDTSEIFFDDIYYYIKPKGDLSDDWDEVPESIKNTYEKLGIPEAERKYLAGVTAQYESEVVYHRNREDLEAQGVLFCDMDTALKEYPQLVKEYFGKVIPPNDNKYSALNSAAWSGGSFIYVPPGVEANVLTELRFASDLDSTGTIESIIDRLPEGLQNQWVKRSNKILNVGREPTFEDLTVFVEERADDCNSKYGQYVAEKRSASSKPKQYDNFNKSKEKKRNMTTLATSVDGTGVPWRDKIRHPHVLVRQRHKIQGRERVRIVIRLVII